MHGISRAWCFVARHATLAAIEKCIGLVLYRGAFIKGPLTSVRDNVHGSNVLCINSVFDDLVQQLLKILVFHKAVGLIPVARPART